MNFSRLSLAVIFSLTSFVIITPVALAQVPDTAILGDFRCYQADPNDPLIDPLAIVELQDQFGPLGLVDVFDRQDFCVNVKKNLNAIEPDIPNQHFLTYALFTVTIPENTVTVQLEDQFMTSTHSVLLAPTELWVPAEKNHDGIIFPKLTDIHYLCYQIDGDAPNEQVLLFDQFDPQGPMFNVTEPTHLCNPVLKTTADGSVFGEINDEHLKCYDIDPVDIEEDVNISAVIATTQFNEPDGDAITSQDVQNNRLCVIAKKTFPDDIPPIVGGEFLGIDSTALLLAGIQGSAIWMLPLLAGAAGAGAYYIKTRMNKE